MYERTPKDHPLKTVMYEIDMLNYSFSQLPAKHLAAQKSELAKPDFYVYLEDFLLHYRNLLAFFCCKWQEKSDLIISQPLIWAQKDISPKEFSKIIKDVGDIDRRHNYHDDISKYLQHCTTFRHEVGKAWDVKRMYEQVKPYLDSFLEKFGTKPKKVELNALEAYTTCSITSFGDFGNW